MSGTALLMSSVKCSSTPEFGSDEAFADYRRGPVVKKIGEQLIPLLEAPPSSKHFSATVLQQG